MAMGAGVSFEIDCVAGLKAPPAQKTPNALRMATRKKRKVANYTAGKSPGGCPTTGCRA